MQKKIALIIGAGDSLGGAIAKRFAQDGFEVCVGRRNGDKLAPLVEEIRAAGGIAHPFTIDARNEEDVIALFDQIEREIGPLEVVVFNPGANIRFSILEMTSRKYYKVWEMACFAGFLTGREAARRMVPRGRGTILFSGATASVRGGSGFSAFAGAKMALRGLAQSMARELGPQGIHVAHVIIDGAIDTPWIREMFPEMVAEGEWVKQLDSLRTYCPTSSDHPFPHHPFTLSPLHFFSPKTPPPRQCGSAQSKLDQ